MLCIISPYAAVYAPTVLTGSGVTVLRSLAAMCTSQQTKHGTREGNGCYQKKIAIYKNAGWLGYFPCSHLGSRPGGWLAERERSHLRSCRGRREPRRPGRIRDSHPPADGCDGCMPAILRPGGWPGHSHRSHRQEDGCAGWMAAKMARAGRAEWLGRNLQSIAAMRVKDGWHACIPAIG